VIDPSKLDWDIVLKGLGVMVGALASLFQIRSLVPPSRTRLKADLEILTLLDPSDEAAPLLRAHAARITSASLSAFTSCRILPSWHLQP
jgi:hypothetical protein